uniref:Uncharacterized protein n=1 Tax=Mesocestoides corti TaxID=53468 RepID=A0A5K3F5J7_MESCO
MINKVPCLNSTTIFKMLYLLFCKLKKVVPVTTAKLHPIGANCHLQRYLKATNSE